MFLLRLVQETTALFSLRRPAILHHGRSARTDVTMQQYAPIRCAVSKVSSSLSALIHHAARDASASVVDQQTDFIYRLESDSQSGNLTGVINFCSELGGYPIYANNAYEWQLIQGQFLCHSCDTDETGRTSDAVHRLI